MAKGAKGAAKGVDESREESLLAVVVADSFENKFRPFTEITPRCLLPLVNVPIIEYTLEFLAFNGVRRVLIYACNHTEQVEAYIRNSRWTRPASPFEDISVLKTVATSVGDCMRDLDARDIVAGDFLVVAGDVISNIDLEPALQQHKARKAKSKDAIMTMVLRPACPLPQSRQRCVFVLDPDENRCLHYEELYRDHYASLEPDLLKDQSRLEVRTDLVDAYIDICTPEVLAQWSDNFDYQTLRSSFLFGVLKDHELNGKTIHTFIAEHGYAARVSSLHAYRRIHADIMRRRVPPYCPDFGIFGHFAENTPHRSTKITRSVLDNSATIGTNSIITDSAIGRNCRIGKDVHLSEAVLWDNVTVHDNAVVHGPVILASHSTLENGCQVNAGALLPSSTTVKAGAEWSTQEDDSESDTSGLIFCRSQGSSSSLSTFASEDVENERRESLRSDYSDETAGPNRKFQMEAANNIHEGMTDGHAADTIFLELNGFRMSVDASPSDIHHAMVAAFVRRIDEVGAGREAIEKLFAAYGGLMERLILDKAEDDKADQVSILLRMQREAVSRPHGGQLLLFMAKEMYDQDILEEEGILQWWEDMRSTQGEEMINVRHLTAQFVTYLREAEEDEDDSS